MPATTCVLADRILATLPSPSCSKGPLRPWDELLHPCALSGTVLEASASLFSAPCQLRSQLRLALGRRSRRLTCPGIHLLTSFSLMRDVRNRSRVLDTSALTKHVDVLLRLRSVRSLISARAVVKELASTGQRFESMLLCPALFYSAGLLVARQIQDANSSFQVCT